MKHTARWILLVKIIDYIKTPDNFEHYKIILPASNGSGAIGEVRIPFMEHVFLIFIRKIFLFILIIKEAQTDLLL